MSDPVGVVRFLGTNCDADVGAALDTLGIPWEYVWWADHCDPDNYRAFVLPGGFSYGDYLRAGALAARAPVMDDVRKAAGQGVPILGICNGFQVLCESQLLPGALTKNISRQFQDEWVEVEPRTMNTAFSSGEKRSLRLPIAHSLGRFLAPDNLLDELFEKNQVWLLYKKNPNGSLRDIAGITNSAKNVVGLMPHPERAMHEWMGSRDGSSIFEAIR